MRRHFSGPNDLPQIQDVNLLRACREIGLLSDVGFTQIDHIRYMRNYASAAHPNQVELMGLQLASWLETCIRQVITLPPDKITAHTGRLLANIKADRLDAASIAATAIFCESCLPTAPTLSRRACLACTPTPGAPRSWPTTSGCSGPSCGTS
jgi:hypothetical protein